MKKYTSKSKISDIIENPKNAVILKKYRVPCLTCPYGPMEMTELEIGKVTKVYGIDLKKLLEKLNK